MQKLAVQGPSKGKCEPPATDCNCPCQVPRLETYARLGSGFNTYVSRHHHNACIQVLVPGPWLKLLQSLSLGRLQRQSAAGVDGYLGGPPAETHGHGRTAARRTIPPIIDIDRP